MTLPTCCRVVSPPLYDTYSHRWYYLLASQGDHRVLLEGEPEAAGVDLSLLEHISPVGWDNVILYGEYVLNQSLVRT